MKYNFSKLKYVFLYAECSTKCFTTQSETCCYHCYRDDCILHCKNFYKSTAVECTVEKCGQSKLKFRRSMQVIMLIIAYLILIKIFR